MRLPVIPVHSFEDATLNAEALQKTLTTPGAALPFLQLLSAKNVQVAFGTVTFTFTASGVSATQTVSHGLTRTPIGVFLQNGGAVGYAGLVTGTSTTTFTAQAFTTAGNAVTSSVGFYWLAIG